MIMVADAQHTAAKLNHSAPKVSRVQPLTPLQELEARTKLIHALQMTLDPSQLLAIFYQQIQSFIKVSGVCFNFADERTAIKLGRDCLHHCDYRLNTNEGYLGEIIFSRAKRFAEDELASLEVLLGSLVYPLRNAFKYQKAMHLALQDPLTGLGNRTALDNALHRELQLAERHEQEFSLLMIDIDHFKMINDQHGHSRGDQVLREVSRCIQLACRESDIVFRYGGEEFVVLLSKTDLPGAWVIAERIRNQIASLSIEGKLSAITPSVSIGIGTHKANTKEHASDLFEQADKALYFAKASGRNCIKDQGHTN